VPLQILKNPIQIFKEELDVIKTCGSMRKQKLLFTLLCYSKASDATNNWVTASARDLFKSAGVNITVAEQNNMIYELKEQGFLRNSKKIISNNIFVDVFPDGVVGGEVAFDIEDLRSLGAVYQAYIGGSAMAHKTLKKCRCCGAPFIDSSTKNNQLYCPVCQEQEKNS